jgi:hypothetical protein
MDMKSSYMRLARLAETDHAKFIGADDIEQAPRQSTQGLTR